jgi:hypothetical protein
LTASFPSDPNGGALSAILVKLNGVVSGQEKEATTVNSQSTVRLIWVSAVGVLAFSASRTALAESLELQCRAAARAEVKGPNCRMWMPPTKESLCNMWPNTQIGYYDN